MTFYILLTSLTFNSKPCWLRTRYVIIYSFRWHVEPLLTSLLPGSVWVIRGGFITACPPQEVTRSLTCSPVSHFWRKRRGFYVLRTKVHSNTERDFVVKYTVFVLQYSVYYSEEFFCCEKLCKDDILQHFGCKYGIKFLCISFFTSTLMSTV
jgi:hypothetical protein